ncbi:tripartite tricarboxylate transporter TctB family protein [Rhizobium terrae]|uniref:tripartite tricarboxylate transporter TctB family protein n=1 Tax=Rhizobium terrae TaxID=2171756 RepID=UPI000E3D1FD9|nr:tripartite tricarboxylate transporter TctB family protein [Rhizobium terrae]
MNSLKVDTTNLICGLLLIATGLFFALESLDLELGTALRMGPGYFPFILACVLILLGGIVLGQAVRVQGEPIGAIAWRGMVFILPAPIIFGLTVRGLGFVPAVFICALVAAFASQRMKPLTAVALSAALTVFSLLVFSYGLGLPFRTFGPWLGF